MLFSSSSFSIAMHFCMGELETVSLIGKAESCQMIQERPSCGANQSNISDEHHRITNENSCCQDQKVLIDGQNEVIENSIVAFSEIHLAAIVAPLDYIWFETIIVDGPSYKNYCPPLIDRDIQVLVQSFLI